MRELQFETDDLQAYLDEVFPQQAGRFRIEELRPMGLRMRCNVREADLRPGDTVSGPTMFTLADCAFYAVTLAMIGRQSLTVTTSLNINFLRKPPAADLVAEARILKLGRTLSVGDVEVFSAALDEPVAHAAVTYAIPPARP